jgi:hypothetical protein
MMMIRTLMLASLSAAVAAVEIKPILQMRGGMVDAATAAKVGTALVGINGLYCGIAPKPASQAYGLKDASFEVVEMIKGLGYTFVSIALLSILSLSGMGLGMAFAWSSVPWVLQNLDNLLNGTGAKMGQPVWAPLLLLGIVCAASYCGVTGTAMPLAAQLYAGWCVLNGAFFAIAPAKGSESWGMKADDKFNAMFKNFGFSLVSFAVLLFSLAAGVDAPKAVGYSFAVMLVNIVDALFVSKTFDALEADKAPAYVWAAIQASVLGLTLA